MKHIDILEQPDDVRALIAECELTGRKTLFERQEQPVAILISYDEYMALRETIDINNDAELRELAVEAEPGELSLPEDLFGRRLNNDRIRISEIATRQWATLAAHERDVVAGALALLDEDPIAGAPLFDPLRGLWSHRREHLRIVYRIMPEARFILIQTITRVAETS